MIAGYSMLTGNQQIIEYFKTSKGHETFAQTMVIASKMDTTVAPTVVGQVVEIGASHADKNKAAAGKVPSAVLGMTLECLERGGGKKTMEKEGSK